ncbi:MAG: hypothetical protein R3202_07810 [Candidatus Competibacterales bacterium]|nr:hypothetical protein [Candidatus Competibacterales bacterium]
MLQIRPDQITPFVRADAAHYPTRLQQLLQTAYPLQCSLAGPEALTAAVEQGLSAAAGHGFTTQETARLFVELRVVLGSGLDEDPTLPWASAALGEAVRGDPLDRARRLHDAALAYIEPVHGLDDGLAETARQRLLEEPLELRSGNRDRFKTTVQIRLAHLWPEKCAALGDESVQQFIDQAVAAALRRQIKQESAVFAHLCLMFLFGAQYDRDPLLPWAGAALAVADPGERARRLQEEALAHLQQRAEQLPLQTPTGPRLRRPLRSGVQGHPYEAPLDDPSVLAALRKVWEDSQAGDAKARHVEGGYLVRDRDGVFALERWPAGERGGIQPLPLDPDGRVGGLEVLGEVRTQPNPPLDEKGRKWLQGLQGADRKALAGEPYSGESFLLGREEFWCLPAGGDPQLLGDREEVLGS